MKSLINLVACLLADASKLCLAETHRDLKTIEARCQHEGMSFLTITLPDFATEFERALELEMVDSTSFAGWRKRGRLPAFLQGFTSLVFDYDGRMLYEPSSDAVYCVRQICRVLKKVKVDCSEERKTKAFASYSAIEQSLRNYEAPQDEDRCSFEHFSDTLWSNVFLAGFSTSQLVPRHGPGATAERLSGNSKFTQLVWNDRLEREFPFTEHLFSSLNQVECEEHGLTKVAVRSELEELPVRVIQVPKTLKTPRTIAIEPVCMQYAQQALRAWMYDAIQASCYTKRSIRFDDQEVNKRMALRASKDKSYATIDLSDASDRVSYQRVKTMLRSCPDLWAAIDACRTRSAELPGGQILPLAKFASMGSALCFPVESMYFYTIVVHAILRRRNLPCTLGNIVKAAKGVNIFGDDIIVPASEAIAVMSALAHYGCKVNTTKSFWRGSFRESCGMDGFRGVDVTPVYVRELPPANNRHSKAILSWNATSNQFHMAGMWATAHYMRTCVERHTGSLPVVLETSPGLGWTSFLGIPSSLRTCKNKQVPLVRTLKVRQPRVPDPLSGYPALLKYFLRQDDRPHWVARLYPLATDGKHLTSSARLGVVSRKRQWVPAY